MNDLDITPNYRALMQDLSLSFQRSEPYTLTDAEVMTVHLALIRLRDIEDMAAKQDWSSIAEYCPQEDAE